MQAVAAAHPHYRSVLARSGLTADDFRSIDDLGQLPLTSKQDYIADPQAFRLNEDRLPDDFGLEERVIWDIAYTSGTTGGKPSPFYNTTHDIYGILDQARRCNDAEGLVAADRIANLYPVAAFPTGAFLSVTRSGMIGGQPVVYGMTGSANSDFRVRNSTAEAIEKIEPVRPTVLWGVPSFIRRFVADACARGADFSDVRLVVTSGEPVSENLRTELRANLQTMGAREIGFRARYAFTEMQGGLVQCADDSAPQNIMLVNTDVVLDYLGAIDGVGDVQIEFRRDDVPGAMDEMILRIERDGDEALRDRISADIRNAVSMRPEIRFVDRGTLYDQTESIKLRRIIDSRPPSD